MIPTNDPLRAITDQRTEIDLAISRVLSSGYLILGPENDALSAEISEYLACDYTVLVGNGTDALTLALRSLGVESGDTVVTVANAGGYASIAIRNLGAIPLFVDVRESDLQMDVEGPNGLKDTLLRAPSKPSAIVVTHLFGKAAPIEEIVALAKQNEIPVVEDCAQSFGAEVGGQKLGTFGEIAATSFYPTKNLGALGDGGAVITSSFQLAEKAKSLRQYGWSSRYNSSFPGAQNSRLDEIQAAVLRIRLKRIDSLNARRQEIHQRYKNAAHENPLIEVPHGFCKSFVAHLAIVVAEDRDDARKALRAQGISTDVHYPLCDYQQAAFSEFRAHPLPVSEKSVSKIFSLPIFPEMREQEIQQIEEALSG